MSYLRNSLALLLLVAGCFCAGAQERDTVAHEKLSDSIITEKMDKPMVLSWQGISGEVNTGKISAIPSVMGNADPIRFVRLLPSVQLCTEMEGGLYMQGSEAAMTLVSQQGVPVYGITHLLGLFSVFNTPHFKGIQYATTSGQEARLAGLIDIQLKDTVAILRRPVSGYALRTGNPEYSAGQEIVPDRKRAPHVHQYLIQKPAQVLRFSRSLWFHGCQHHLAVETHQAGPYLGGLFWQPGRRRSVLRPHQQYGGQLV